METPVQCNAKQHSLPALKCVSVPDCNSLLRVSMFLVARCMFGVCLCNCMLEGDIVT